MTRLLQMLFGELMAPDGGGSGGGEGAGAGAGGEGGEGGEGSETGSPAGGEGGGSGEETPPWEKDGETFDPSRAWELIKNLRGDNKKLKGERDEFKGKVDEHEEAQQTEQEKLEGRATKAETEAKEARQEAARLRVALKKGLTETQAKRLVGETEEDLEKDADELLESFKGDDDDEEQDSRRRPRERLRPGAVPDADADDSDPAKLAGQVSRGY